MQKVEIIITEAIRLRQDLFRLRKPNIKNRCNQQGLNKRSTSTLRPLLGRIQITPIHTHIYIYIGTSWNPVFFYQIWIANLSDCRSDEPSWHIGVYVTTSSSQTGWTFKRETMYWRLINQVPNENGLVFEYFGYKHSTLKKDAAL